MGYQDVVSVLTENEDATKRFGDLFAWSFVRPLMGRTGIGAPQSLVVAAYGIDEIGKTHFLKSAENFMAGADRLFSEWRTDKIEDSQIDGLRVRRADLGTHLHRHMSSYCDGRKLGPWIGYKIGFMPRRENGWPGIDYLEHPTLPYIKSGGAIVVMADLTSAKTRQASRDYLSTVEAIIEGQAKPFGASTPELLRRFLDPNNVSAKLLDVIDKTIIRLDAKQAWQDARSGPTRNSRILSIVLTKNTQAARVAFLDFRFKAERLNLS